MLYSLPSAMIERSPWASFFGGSVEDWTCMIRCWLSFSRKSQPSVSLSACVPVITVPL
jgi:hypothetical protein